MSELNRCGCGGRAADRTIYTEGRHKEWFMVRCAECGIHTRNYSTPRQAIEAWNRAMSKPLIPERVDEIVEEEIYDGEGGYEWDTPEELAREIGRRIKQELEGEK